jgi:hypothetical protein
MGRACGTFGRQGRRIQGFGEMERSESERERDYLEDLGVDGRILLKSIFRKLDGVMGCIDLAEDWDR